MERVTRKNPSICNLHIACLLKEEESKEVLPMGLTQIIFKNFNNTLLLEITNK